MISVADALAQILDLFSPLNTEIVRIEDAGGRILSQSVTANRDQPPFAASAMDGYAVKSIECEPDSIFQVVGEAAAGAGFDGEVTAGKAVRIFTGAPVPRGADRILIQEDCTRSGNLITVSKDIDDAHYIRPQGGDFKIGTLVEAPLKLGASEISLLAAMGLATIPVYRKPVVALIATGDELVHPSETPSPDQIISSNNYGLKAMIEQHGGQARLLPIARDTQTSLTQVLKMADGADVIVTLGGASVGDHDLMGKLARDGALDAGFYKVAMRPGKPLMAGRYNGTPLIGLPGNPVSALVCGSVFLIPALRAMLGLGKSQLPTQSVPVSTDMSANGPRCHYMRARVENGVVTPFGRQDSSLLSVMTQANALLIREPNAPAIAAGTPVEIVPL